jgi:hypothetical protein
LTDDQLYGEGKFAVDPFWKETPRRILQLAGTECMRQGYDQDIWARTLERRAVTDPDTSVVIGDVRFPNEVDAVHRLGGIVVRVDREVPGTAEDFHLSEIALADYRGWDRIVRNDGSLDALSAKVRDVISTCHSMYRQALDALGSQV